MSAEMIARRVDRVVAGKRSRFVLGLRLALALGLGAAAIVTTAGLYNLHMQRHHLLEIVNTAGDRIVETIRASTRDAMLRNQPDDVRRIIATIGSQPGVDRIRVFDKQGRIQTSTVAAEVGTLVDTNAEECHACHQRDRPLDRLDRQDRMRIFEVSGGPRVMGVISPIRNEVDCAVAGCHASPEEQRLLGVLDVRLSLADVDDDLSASQFEMTLGLTGTALAVLLLALLLSWGMVLKPVHRLTDAAARVTAGDLSATVSHTSSDEIGDLSAAWNAMVQEVAKSRDQLEAGSQLLERKVKEKTEELEHAHEHILLVEKMASLGKLAAVVAHEINNPLAGISTYAKLLHKRLSATVEATGASNETQETLRILQMMDTEAMRCGDIVRNLLLFSRSTDTDFASNEFPPLVQRCVMLVRHQAELAEVKLDVELEEEIPPIVCDASQIEQTILALTMNAIEASEAGGAVTIRSSFDHHADGLRLTVSDTGSGIPPEHLPRVFEPFFTTKTEGAGVGLGLAVVYGIVHRHHGCCDVDSTPETGTTVTVWLPRQQPGEAERR